MSRYRADQAVVWTWDDRDGDRTCVAWRSATHWEAIKRALTSSSLRHRGLKFDPLRRRWSVPAWHRDALEEWVRWTFEPACVLRGQQPAGWHERTGRAG